MTSQTTQGPSISERTEIEVVSDLEECARLWNEYHPDPALLCSWDLRATLAELYGATPLFLVENEHGSVLPTAVCEGTIQFFGGSRYSERNALIGPRGGASSLFEALASRNEKFRLLCMTDDSLPYLPDGGLKWEVPFNQYWELPAFDSFETYREGLSKKINGVRRRADFDTILARFEPAKVETADWPSAGPLIREFISHSRENFKQRARKSAYEDEIFVSATMEVCRYFASSGMLRTVEICTSAGPVGLGVFIEDVSKNRVVNLLQLMRSGDGIPARLAEAILISVIRHCTNRGLSIDTGRGAFAIKPRYGFAPTRAYALVRDLAWQVMPSTDLTEDQLLELYGRPVGLPAAEQSGG